MNLEELYENYLGTGDAKKRAEGLLAQTHWLSSIADFDPRSGRAMPMCFTEVLRRAGTGSFDGPPKDRVWHLVEHSRQAVKRLLGRLTEEPRRVSEYLPIRAVRDLDTASFVALSRRPGRTIREKLSDKPYMKAVKHYQSSDTSENRLFKAYVKEIVKLLRLRSEVFGEADELLVPLQRWLKSDIALEIGRWENLPPNNTLLSHRDYRRVWDSWRLLQTLDSKIEFDYENYGVRANIKNHWMQLAKSYSSGKTQFAEMPVIVNWDAFKLDPWEENPLRRQKPRRRRGSEFPICDTPTCVDLAALRPAFSSITGSGTLREFFVWQEWTNAKKADDSVDICLFGSDALLHHEDAITVTAPDMFFSRGLSKNTLSAAADAFSARLSKLFDTETLVWLTPDCLNEFELDSLRRSLNSFFKYAEPLPYSVAAVIDNVDYEEIAQEESGYSVAVLQTTNGMTCKTVLTARYDEELKKAVPETCGYIWERDVPEIVRRGVVADKIGSGIAEIDANGEWSDCYNPYGVLRQKNDKKKGVYDKKVNRIIDATNSPVDGGSWLIELQKKAGNIPIWRSKIPELMTKVFNESTGQMEYFYFVEKKTTVRPIRGAEEAIPIDKLFVIPAGKRHFELYQGTNESTGIDGEAIEYVAFLDSPDMPFSEDVPCRLKMTYKYGSDSPYNLVFKPLDKELSPIQVEWRSKAELPPENVKGPDYPVLLDWASLQNQINPKTGEKSDFLAWMIEGAEWLVSYYKPKPKTGIITSDWRWDINDRRYAYSMVGDTSVWIHEDNFVYDIESKSVSRGSKVFFFLSGPPDRRKGVSISTSGITAMRDYCENHPKSEAKAMQRVAGNSNKHVDTIHSYLYVPFIRTWSEGRSLSDVGCPIAFKQRIVELSQGILKLSENELLPESVRNEYRFLLCCMGDDMPERAALALSEQARTVKSPIIARSCGFALGNVTRGWQKGMLSWLVSFNDEFSLRALADAAWHSPEVIKALDLASIRVISDRLARTLKRTLSRVSQARRGKEIFDCEYWYGVKYMELLLALLRTRNAAESELSELLQPWQEQTRSFAQTVEALASDEAFCKVSLGSRIKLDLPPRLDDEKGLPPLLYALKLYLVGDDRFNAIRIIGITEE